LLNIANYHAHIVILT